MAYTNTGIDSVCLRKGIGNRHSRTARSNVRFDRNGSIALSLDAACRKDGPSFLFSQAIFMFVVRSGLYPKTRMRNGDFWANEQLTF